MAKRIHTDLQKLQEMVSGMGFRATGISVTFTPIPDAPPGSVTPHSVVILTNGRDTLELESDDFEVSMYALSLKAARDEAGTRKLRPIADLNKYWDEIEELARDADAKRTAARERIASREFRFKYPPKALLARFLASRRWGDAEFAGLKRDHFEIQAFFLAHARQLLSTQKTLYQNKPGAKQYSETVDEILRKAFRTDEDPVGNYLKFEAALAVDTEDALVQALGQHRIVKDTLGMLKARRTVPGEVGIPHLLDIYRRLSEALVPVIRVLSDAVCVAEGRRLPDPGLGFSKRCEVVRQSKYGDLMRCLGPAIRHSESHAATRVDKAAGKVFLTELAEGRRRTIGEYTFEQVADMTRVSRAE